MNFTDIYLDIQEMVINGLLQEVVRPDGQIGYQITALGQAVSAMYNLPDDESEGDE